MDDQAQLAYLEPYVGVTHWRTENMSIAALHALSLPKPLPPSSFQVLSQLREVPQGNFWQLGGYIPDYCAVKQLLTMIHILEVSLRSGRWRACYVHFRHVHGWDIAHKTRILQRAIRPLYISTLDLDLFWTPADQKAWQDTLLTKNLVRPALYDGDSTVVEIATLASDTQLSCDVLNIAAALQTRRLNFPAATRNGILNELGLDRPYPRIAVEGQQFVSRLFECFTSVPKRAEDMRTSLQRYFHSPAHSPVILAFVYYYQDSCSPTIIHLDQRIIRITRSSNPRLPEAVAWALNLLGMEENSWTTRILALPNVAQDECKAMASFAAIKRAFDKETQEPLTTPWIEASDGAAMRSFLLAEIIGGYVQETQNIVSVCRSSNTPLLTSSRCPHRPNLRLPPLYLRLRRL
ncbi:hypothetical protein DL93DRAFT_2096930 [Clavulina sp. PMI_390]|nr:hypothetical protein DL93DRAFT_2096930 [Clavulina sp. PMI_390]